MVLLYSINALNSQNLTEINECLKIININYKNFFLVGCLINKQFYRPTEYSKYFLSENSNNEKFALTKQFFLQQKKIKNKFNFSKK